jgi:hypothetical protein
MIKKPTAMGRFHYWLSTSQVTKFGPVLHRPPFVICLGLIITISIHIVVDIRIIAYKESSVKYLILSELYQHRTNVLAFAVPLGHANNGDVVERSRLGPLLRSTGVMAFILISNIDLYGIFRPPILHANI